MSDSGDTLMFLVLLTAGCTLICTPVLLLTVVSLVEWMDGLPSKVMRTVLHGPVLCNSLSSITSSLVNEISKEDFEVVLLYSISLSSSNIASTVSCNTTPEVGYREVLLGLAVCILDSLEEAELKELK